MKNKGYHIGVDTSAYTTSLAIVDEDFNIIMNNRYLLKVEQGNRGLRQQEAVFQHITNLSANIEEIFKDIDKEKIISVSSSNKPRNVEGSYMPVFMVSELMGKTIASLTNSQIRYFSHQDGHLAVYLDCLIEKEVTEFIGLHFSGGTSEILEVKFEKGGFDAQIIGGTLDISFGKLVDRIGVELGLGFPAGKSVELLACDGKDSLKKYVSVKDGWFNLSGAETSLIRAIEAGSNPADVALTTELVLEKTLIKALEQLGVANKGILFTGGVSANERLRKALVKKYANQAWLPEKALCTDNAVGLAKLGCYHSLKDKAIRG